MGKEKLKQTLIRRGEVDLNEINADTQWEVPVHLDSSAVSTFVVILVDFDFG